MSNPAPASQGAGSAPQKYRCAVRSRTDPDKLEYVEITASSPEEAVSELHEKKYLIISVRESEEGRSKLPFARPAAPAASETAEASPKDRGFFSTHINLSFLNRVTNRELIGFVIQLAALLKAGIPLVQSLKIVHRGTTNPYFQTILDKMIDDVRQGFSFHHAVARQGKVFPSIFPNLIEVGEVSGTLVKVLEEIAHYQEATARMTSKVISAFFYPVILLFLAAAAVIFLLMNIIPKFESIFLNLRIELPLITQIVMAVSRVIRFYGPFVWSGLAAVLFAIHFAVKHPRGRMAVDTLLLRLPVMGTLFLQVAIVRFTRGFGTMLHAGIPILNALKIAAKLTANSYIIKIFDDIHDNVQAGHGLGMQLEKFKFFPPFMTSLITVGEESGEMVHFLKIVADYYEERVETFLGRLGAVIEPILLVVVGAIIGVIVIAIFLPLIDLSTMGGR